MISRSVIGPPDDADEVRVGAAVVPLPDPLQVGSGGGGGGPLGRAILARLRAGTLLRQEWTGTTDDGREAACLLATIAPACGEAQSTIPCPADVMPAWLVPLTPWLNDAGTEQAWTGHVREYAALVDDFGRLTSEPATGRIALAVILQAIADRSRRSGIPSPASGPAYARATAHSRYAAEAAAEAAYAAAAEDDDDAAVAAAAADDLIVSILAALRAALQVPR